MVEYIGSLLDKDEYPALSEMVATHGLAGLWDEIHGHVVDERRFDRNLRRLLSGFDVKLKRS